VFKFEGWSESAGADEKGDHTVSYDLESGYYDVGLQPLTQRFVGIEWEGMYCVFSCLLFWLSITPWISSKMMKGMGRRCGIRNLPYLDDFFFPKKGFRVCRLVGIHLMGTPSKHVSR